MTDLRTTGLHTHGAATTLDELDDGITGTVVQPRHAAYDRARSVWNASIDRFPLAVVQCHTVDDIRRGLAHGVEQGLPVAVRGGGHNVAGHGTCDEGIVLDLRAMAHVEVRPRERIAVAGPGTVGGEFDSATQQHGLATTMGVMSTTGIAGLTLGGGIGWLQRALGLTCDSLVGADVLTAAGRLVRASSDTNPDLFWGLRGGGGNFGIVTSFKYRLHPIGPEVMCGLAAWPARQAGSVLRAFRVLAAEAPDELTVIAICRTAPAAPFLPEAMHGQPIIALAACYAGSVDDGAEAIAGLRAIGESVGDAFAPRPYAEFQSMFDASWDPGLHNYWKAEYLDRLDDETIDVLARYACSHTSPLSDFKVAMMGGAVARVDEEATAFSHRDASFVLNINTRWTDMDESPHHIDHTHRLFEDATAGSGAGTYVNFLGLEGTERVRHAYTGPTFQRLRTLKRTWDPDNVFHLNQNITPAD